VQKLSAWERKEIIKRLYALAEATGDTLTPKRIDLYLQCLADLDAEKVTAALDGALLSCKWFPKIPEIRDIVLGPVPEKKLLDDAEAEAAWEKVLNFVDRWHPDIGAFRDAPLLSELEQRALNTVGGPAQVQDQVGGGKGLPFLHRDFLAAFQRLRLTETACFQMLGTGEARAILGKVRLGLPEADRKPGVGEMQSIAEVVADL
jgi:hypothetical protein